MVDVEAKPSELRADGDLDLRLLSFSRKARIFVF